MRTYYTQKHAVHYKGTWHTFLQKTLAATLSAIDFVSLQQRARAEDRPLRLLDAACGTGILLEQFSHLFPDAELYGVDVSSAMLAQAAQLLHNQPRIQLVQASLDGGQIGDLPYPPAFFDLITCTNTLHYLNDPTATIEGFKRLLTPEGQVVIEDYMLRGFPFPWKAFERAIKLYDPQHIRLYTLEEVQTWCQQAGFQVIEAHLFRSIFFVKGGLFSHGKQNLPDRLDTTFCWGMYPEAGNHQGPPSPRPTDGLASLVHGSRSEIFFTLAYLVAMPV